MKTIYIVDIEPVETRYTKEWRDHLPIYIEDYAKNVLKQHCNVVTISGTHDIPAATTPGAFLNFGGTNIYKASQAIQISTMFCNGTIKAGDHILYTDAWNPTILQTKYMSDLLNIPVIIHGLWHAGSYDPNDFLGRVKDKTWLRYTEKALLLAINYNYFATEFHERLLADTLLTNNELRSRVKRIRTGWPMTYVKEYVPLHSHKIKRNMIVFPHRIAPEKQLVIFKELAYQLPQYEFVVCQEKALTKEQYHAILASSKMVFSANLQETLGISCYEGACHKSIPMVPDRLSYTEMYLDEFKYPSKWTEDFIYAIEHIDDLKKYIIDRMENYDSYMSVLDKQVKKLDEIFFSSNALLENIFKN